MANAPQGNGGGHAEGGYVGTLTFTGPGTVPNPTLSNRDQGTTNIVQNIDFKSVAPDMPNDRDYDDPYPGGPTATLGVPGDG